MTQPSPDTHTTSEQIDALLESVRLREVRDRIDYFYLQTDLTYEFPNTKEGDLLKIVHKALNELPVELQKLLDEASIKARIDELKQFSDNYGYTDWISDRVAELTTQLSEEEGKDD